MIPQSCCQPRPHDGPGRTSRRARRRPACYTTRGDTIVERAEILGDALFKPTEIEGTVPVERLVPGEQQNAEAVRHFRRPSPEVTDKERGGFVHGVALFMLPKRVAPARELHGCRYLHVGPH